MNTTELAYNEGYHWFSFNRDRTKEQFNKDLELAYYGQSHALTSLRKVDIKGFVEGEIISVAGWVSAIIWSGPRRVFGSLFKSIGITL